MKKTNTKNKKRLGKRLLLFSLMLPVLFSIFPILVFYLNNISELSLKFLEKPILLSVLGSILLYSIILLIFRNQSKSSLLASLLVFIFFSYGHLSKYLNSFLFIKLSENLVLGPDKILLPILVLFLTFFVYKLFKTKKKLTNTVLYLFIILVFLVLYNLLIIVTKENQRSDMDVEQNTGQAEITHPNNEKPDIYHIILDGYAREDVLKDVYNFDNSKFINDLREMGFFVADNARSNYIHTYLSLPSTFNMRYLDELPEKYGLKPLDKWAAIELMFDNDVSRILKNNGYTTINFASGWEGTDELYPADINYNQNMNLEIAGLNVVTNETNMVFLQTTLLSPFIKEMWNDIVRMKILFALSKIPDLAYQDTNKFVIAHFVAPHPPYVFKSDGSKIEDPRLSMVNETFENKSGYIEQLTYMNKQTKNTINKLIENSSKPPIIVLHSDHGPASILGHPTSWRERFNEEGGIKERTSILYAIYLPDKDYSDFYSNITPVNTYRIILNKYFGKNLELLPDKSYFSNYDAMYDFIDVTNL